jgi:hypothetical protein
MWLRQAEDNFLYSGKRDTRADWCAEFVTSIAGSMRSRWSWIKARAALAENPANRTAVIPASAIEAWITLEVLAVKSLSENLAGYRTFSALRVAQRDSFA